MIHGKFIHQAVLTGLTAVVICRAELPEPPFSKGVNLAGWFQHVQSASEIQFSRFTYQDFENIRSLGCDHIRLPVELSSFTGPSPDYILDPLILKFLDEVISWAEDLGIHFILDNHSFDPSVDTSQEILDLLIPVWKQLAERYRERSGLIYYEILNEPHGVSDVRWNEIQQGVIDAIRMIDSTHTLVIGPAGWNSYNNLQYMPVYSDTLLIYTFHFYAPFLFTHQGAGWVEPSMETLEAVPYPYNAQQMPELPGPFRGTWIESSYQQYPQQGNDAYVRSLIDIAVQFGEERQAVLWCGEFGAYLPNSRTEDRARWHETVRTCLEENRIAWSLWEYNGGFGIFEPGSNGLFESDINAPIVESLGLAVPTQQPFELKPDTTGFVIYDDYVREHIEMNQWLGAASADFYHELDPYKGDFCMTWTGADQYDVLNFGFSPVRDLTRLVDEEYWLEFWIRGSSSEVSIDVRFVDTDTEDPDDHPWRMHFRIDDQIIDWNGTWQQVRIPLNDFTEQGAWEDAWFNPRGDYDWSRTAMFEIVAEYHDLKMVDLAFDEIRVSCESEISRIPESDTPCPKQIELDSVYPNPFNEQAMIRYTLLESSRVQLRILDILGREAVCLLHEKQGRGTFQIQVNGALLTSGIYIMDLRTDHQICRQKMVLIK